MVQKNVRETLKKLVAIQEVDEVLYEHRRQIKEKPVELNELKAKFDKKKTRLTQLQTRAQELELSRKAKELDLKSKEADIIKADGTLMTLKTNKEYQAKLFEIENLKADKSILEEEILKMMDETETLAQEVTKEQAVVAEEEKGYLAEKAKVDAAIAEIEDGMQSFEAKRRELVQDVDKEALAIYQRIVENREGVALVPVVGSSCGGCFMNVPPQVINRLKMHEELVRCEMCARLLYLKEEL
ncbi:MAG: hypothetical protein GX606_00375 [Elusimicrobia bacterium]|nr:hypothetical protein [Elusimicrobiota bacterium]